MIASGLTIGLLIAAAGGVKPAGTLELVLLGEEKLARIELRIEADGKTVPAIWDRTFQQIFAEYTIHPEKGIDAKEAERLPSPFSLRQLLWGQSVPYSGPKVAWKELDRNNDGNVSEEELASYYRRNGLGGVLVGVGRPQATQALTEAIIKALDTDNNGTVSAAEWKAAPEALRKFDRNDDELIGPGELVPKTAYPGTSGAILMSPPGSDNKPVPELDGLPFVILPSEESNTQWASLVTSRRDRNGDGKLDQKEAGLPGKVFAGLDADRDGKLSAEELTAWRRTEPTSRYTIRIGKRTPGQPAFDAAGESFSAGALRLDVRSDEGRMTELVAAARKRFLERFTDADANADGVVELQEITKPNQAELKQLLIVADRDGDGKLSRAEVTAWLDLQDQIAKGHVLLTVLDHGAGLFELLDRDHDGSLSLPELRHAWPRVLESGCVTPEAKLDMSRLPRQLILTASRGHPVNPLGSARRDGPAWFRAMDRNGDGCVSRREFTGTAEVFDKLDRDHDGLLGPEEVEKTGR